MDKYKILTGSLLILLILTPQAIQAQQKEGPIELQVGSQHAIEVVTQGSLLWQQGVNEILNLNISMSQFPTNESRIDINLIRFFTLEETPNAVPESQTLNTTEFSLDTNNPTYQVNQTLSPPVTADRFYINITISAIPIGGNASQTPYYVSYRFPSSTTILVQRDNLVPLVNLYGFPSKSFFQVWMPIYLVSLILLSVPAFIFAGVKTKESLKKQEGSQEVSEESEKTIEKEDNRDE